MTKDKCKWKWEYRLWYSIWKGSCGAFFDCEGELVYCTKTPQIPFNYCPNCGKECSVSVTRIEDRV